MTDADESFGSHGSSGSEAVDGPTAQAWAALGGAAGPAGLVSYRAAGDVLAARLPVRQLARACVGVCSLAAAELVSVRTGKPLAAVRVDEGAVATAFVSERHLRIGGRTPTTFAPLSGFWRAADGWVRTHANYPHHRDRLLDALGIRDGERLAEVVAELPAVEVQERVYAAGGLAVAVAPPGDAPGRPPLVEMGPAGGEGRSPALAAGALPAEGVRVLDLTRVIAGPVATRTLGLLGADVLRLDSPALPEAADAQADTGFGKRSARLDLDGAAGRRTFEELLAVADVVITGYRPGALDRHGLAPAALTERRPGLVVAQLCAWGWSGPWAGRRGFDSLVQAGCGIARIEAGPDGRPGVLPAQALDHGTGYLLAAAVLRSLTGRQEDGLGRHLRLSLAGTASWLMHGIGAAPAGAGEYEAEKWLSETESAYGPLRHALPPLGFDGAPADWSRPPSRWGTDRAAWLTA
ncbi:CoA transferase [Streptomyces sp. SYSU K21746]